MVAAAAVGQRGFTIKTESPFINQGKKRRTKRKKHTARYFESMRVLSSRSRGE